MRDDDVRPRVSGTSRTVLLLDALTSASGAVRSAVVIGIAATGSLLDWWTGPATSLLFAYSVATVLAAWVFDTRVPAISVAIASSVLTATMNVASPDQTAAAGIVWTNAVLRATSLVLTALIVSAFGRHLVATQQVALVDPLTGALSRHAILHEVDVAVQQARRSGARATVVYLDLDGLKRVNDQQGHAAGDALLRRFADSLLGSVRPTDRFGRLGGDEFLLVCHDTDETQADSLVRRVVAGGPDASWGIATTDGSVGRDTLVAAADARMYEAKRRRRRPA